MTAPMNHTGMPTALFGSSSAAAYAGERETGDHGEQVQRAGTVPAQESAHGQLRNVRLATHLVQCTPGLAGTITRAG